MNAKMKLTNQRLEKTFRIVGIFIKNKVTLQNPKNALIKQYNFIWSAMMTNLMKI